MGRQLLSTIILIYATICLRLAKGSARTSWGQLCKNAENRGSARWSGSRTAAIRPLKGWQGTGNTGNQIGSLQSLSEPLYRMTQNVMSWMTFLRCRPPLLDIIGHPFDLAGLVDGRIKSGEGNHVVVRAGVSMTPEFCKKGSSRLCCNAL